MAAPVRMWPVSVSAVQVRDIAPGNVLQSWFPLKRPMSFAENIREKASALNGASEESNAGTASHPSGPASHRTRCSIPCDTVFHPAWHPLRHGITPDIAHKGRPRRTTPPSCVRICRDRGRHPPPRVSPPHACVRSAPRLAARWQWDAAMLCRSLEVERAERLLDADVWCCWAGPVRRSLVSGICGILCRKGSVHTVFLESPHRGMGPVGCSCVSVRGCSCARARACAFGCGRALAG